MHTFISESKRSSIENWRTHIQLVHHLTDVLCIFKQWLNTLRPEQNGCHVADDIFKCIYHNKYLSPLIQEMVGAEHATIHYPNHWWLVNWGIYALPGLNGLTNPYTHAVDDTPCCHYVCLPKYVPQCWSAFLTKISQHSIYLRSQGAHIDICYTYFSTECYGGWNIGKSSVCSIEGWQQRQYESSARFSFYVENIPGLLDSSHKEPAKGFHIMTSSSLKMVDPYWADNDTRHYCQRRKKMKTFDIVLKDILVVFFWKKWEQSN